jgi:hypothetical protein
MWRPTPMLPSWSSASVRGAAGYDLVTLDEMIGG